MTTPLSVYLPFNRDSLGEAFVPAKSGGKPDVARGRWLLVQDQRLIVLANGDDVRLPTGEAPAGFGEALDAPFWLGTLEGDPCWVAAVPRDHPLLRMENAIIVPHLGSATRQTRQAMARLTVDNLNAGLAGLALPSRIA